MHIGLPPQMEDAIPPNFGCLTRPELDADDHITTFHLTSFKGADAGIHTIRKVWDADRRGFQLAIVDAQGVATTLSYIRGFTAEDIASYQHMQSRFVATEAEARKQ